ncbi:LysM and peptidoglycan-binding domain-containing protein 1 [Spatholobus suberectus]|nr:LysM and peptidoglycan-binding domain-containing protein 1 [Spatholobus suberectus]
MEREKWRDHSNSNGYYDRFVCDYDGEVPSRERSPTKPSSVSSSPPRLSYIEHHVSKFDTLAGVAIKYGVEVVDIKKMNGLVTDHQMFALTTLQIPLPGRHPPSPCLSNGSSTPGHGNSDHSPPNQSYCDLLESFQSLRIKSSERKVSPAMSSLQGYYGLKGTSSPSEDCAFPRNLPMSVRPLSRHRKSKSLVNVILEEIMEKSEDAPAAESREVDSDKWNNKLVQRRQKSVADFTRIPELLLREDNSSSGGLPSRTGKGLALRPKAANRTAVTTDSEPIGLNPVPMGMGDTSLDDGSSAGVRKSSSTSCLQDQDNSGSSSIWPTSMWNLKPDLQALSTAAIGKPIFDGLPKPITGRRNKAALD